jgi:gamma-glutamyltranspeptidase/glutathione hydrolase
MTFTAGRNYEYGSRRSVVMAPNAVVATSQPLATEAGLSVLRAGGSAADAAVAAAAALQVTKPCATGLGGDAFFLYYEAESGTVHAYNGSGRSPAALTLERAAAVSDGAALPDFHPYTVTVPGAADTWCALHGRFGRLPLDRVLAPAVRLASEGFPVAPMTALWWKAGAERQLAKHVHGGELMVDGRGPQPGERFANPGLAHVLTALGEGGREVFYRGWIAERIAAAVAEAGGLLAAEDLAAHEGEWVTALSVPYHGYRLHECPPNGQGLAALLALQVYRELAPRDEAERLHAKVEAMRLGFADAARYVADPDHAPAPLGALLSAEYARRRAQEVSSDHRMPAARWGDATPGSAGSDTVYFCVVDEAGNGCSFINSNFMGFGTGIVPEGCGFSLQNRGRGFVLEPGHPNALAPRKRPYHTIIPALLTEEAESSKAAAADSGPAVPAGPLAAVLGVMGGMMQPQGHLQVTTLLVDEALDPQSALDAPRFSLHNGEPDGTLLVEESMNEDLRRALAERGHTVSVVGGTQRSAFGLGQVIARCGGAWWAGSDPRGDGQAAGY